MIYINCHIHLELGEEVAAEAGSLICGACLARTHLILNEIQDIHAWISDAEYLANTKEPASSYTKSRPPVSLHTVSLLDARTKYRRPGDPVSAERVLKAWAYAVFEIQGKSGNFAGLGAGDMAGCLRSMLPWIARQPAVVRFARHMACVLNSLRQEVGLNAKEEQNDE